MADLPIELVGGSTFGRYPIISSSKTVNMYISDDWLVSYPGYQKVVEIDPDSEGRGIFHSIRGNFLVFVVGTRVFKIYGSTTHSELGYELIGTLNTPSGEVFIDENLASQIVIVDGHKYYTYYYGGAIDEFAGYELGAGIAPGYISYLNGYFLIAKTPTSTNPQEWLVYQKDPASNTQIIQIATGGSFLLETKPDKALAVVAIPGRGNHLMVFGSAVTELWTQVGDVQNFARNSSFNVDYGCVSTSTIATSDGKICWLGANASSSPVIMVSDGATAQPLSTDGINNQLQNVQVPTDSTAYFFRTDGHLFYVLTFFNETDNFSVCYDFSTGKFFHLTDERDNFHPARQVVYFQESTFFAAISDGSIFELSGNIPYVSYVTDSSVKYDLPRIRVANTLRLPDTRPFRVGYFGFLMEQGVNAFYVANEDKILCDYIYTEDGQLITTEGGSPMEMEGSKCVTNSSRPVVDISLSKNGGMTFGPPLRKYLNSQGIYKNRMEFFRLGYMNEFTIQLRFWGLQRFVVNNGTVTIY